MSYQNIDVHRYNSDYKNNYQENSTSTYASSDAGTSSLTSRKGACAAYAGRDEANSTCASLDGKGVSTRAAIDDANSAGFK